MMIPKSPISLLASACLLVLMSSTAFAQSGSDDDRPGNDRPGSAWHLGQKHLEQKHLHQNRAGAFKAPSTTDCELTTTDFVITGASSSSTVNEHCFPNAGGGVFSPRADIAGLSIVDGVDVADLDNDGDNDFLACDGLTGEVYLYSQAPADVFTPSVVATGVTPGGGSFLCTYLRIADFNNDGLRDFVVGDHQVAGGVFVYLQGPVGTFTPQGQGLDLSWASPSGEECNCIFAIATGDANLDGSDDIMMLGFAGDGAGEVWYYQGNGNGAMMPPVQKADVSADFPQVVNPTGLALFDLEGDGDLDLAVGGSFDGSHYVYTNDGVANFSAPATSAFSTNNYSGIDAYDFDGDLDHDLMLVDWTSQRLHYSENLGGVLASPVAVGVVDGPSLGVGAPERPQREDFELDHFKCYRAQAEKPVDTQISLTDQFGDGEAVVIESQRFCNAVTKFHDGQVTEIMNEDAHLEMLSLEAEGKTPSLVEVSNQFGDDQRLEIGPASFIAVPTQKIEPGNHPFPKNLDHFKCYDVIGDSEPVTVSLRDQLGFEEDVEAIAPLLLCNPTKKEHDGVTTPIENPLDHLVCYELDLTKPIYDSTFMRNQFGERRLELDRADLLCLPSRKLVIE